MINGIKNNIPEILFKRDLTIRWLSKEAKLAYGTAHAIVNNDKRGITFEQMGAICRALNLDVGDLFQLADAPQNKESDSAE